jgi:hypothetical protein
MSYEPRLYGWRPHAELASGRAWASPLATLGDREGRRYDFEQIVEKEHR